VLGLNGGCLPYKQQWEIRQCWWRYRQQWPRRQAYWKVAKGREKKREMGEEEEIGHMRSSNGRGARIART
jgi:hypothetical protein